MSKIPVIKRTKEAFVEYSYSDHVRYAVFFCLLLQLEKAYLPLAPIRNEKDLSHYSTESLSEHELVKSMIGMSSPKEFAEYWGYPHEEHVATTLDGYHMGLHRIPAGRHSKNVATYRNPYNKPTVIIW